MIPSRLIPLLLLLCLGACQSTQTNVQTLDAKDSDYYSENHRPQFHFSPESMWMNDPNGMVFFEGEYHLFYQHYPDSNVWGPMHWGHAISEDLVHWEHLPIALYPDTLGYIFSGSAVVDVNNTSGLGKNGKGPLIAIFTHHNPDWHDAGRADFQFQSIAYSNDKGRTWTKYEGNPVIPNPGIIRDFRDPKVIWDETSQQWVMVFAAKDHVAIWGSPDLKSWTHLSDFGEEYGGHGGVWECPDLFPIGVDETGENKWVLLVSINPGGPNGGSATQYFIGDFEEGRFVLDPSFEPSVTGEKAVWLDYGRDNYAGVTWSDIPKEDGRRLFIGWMSNWDYANIVPTEVWRSAMTLSRELVLKNIAGEYRLFSKPVSELASLRESTEELSVGNTESELLLDLSPENLELDLRFEPLDESADFGIELSNPKGEKYRIGYHAEKNRFYSDRSMAGDHSFSDKFASGVHYAPRLVEDATVHLQVFFDQSSIELFADGGATVLTDIFFPSQPFTQAKIYVNNGKLNAGEAYSLNSIWQ